MLEPSWEMAGRWPGASWTPNTGASPSAAKESFLSRILQENAPLKSFLTARACRGIITRAARRGNELPAALMAALITQIALMESGFFDKESIKRRACAADDSIKRQEKVLVLNDQGGQSIGLEKADVSPTLRAESHGNLPVVYCIVGNTIDRSLTAGGNGPGFNEEICYTLNTIDRHAVSAPIAPIAAIGAPCALALRDAAGTLRAGAGAPKHQSDWESLVLTAFASSSFGAYTNGVGTLRTSGGDLGGGSETLLAGRVYGVRRLTTIECERLQGFPDGWTAIGYDGAEISDTQRYKALGNSVAVPCVEFVLSGIARAMD